MPRDLYDAEGNKVEGVLDDAEMKALQDKAKSVEESTATITKLQDDLKTIQSEVNPNWQAARIKMKQLEDENAKLKELEKTGKTLDEKGQVVDFKGNNGPSAEEVARIARESATQATQSAFVENRKKLHLQEFGEDKRKVVEHYFNKLSAGETLTEEKVDEYMESARRASGLTTNPINRANSFSAGKGFTNQNEPEFTDTEQGKAWADRMGLKTK